jgi:hypothetical protein
MQRVGYAQQAWGRGCIAAQLAGCSGASQEWRVGYLLLLLLLATTQQAY